MLHKIKNVSVKENNTLPCYDQRIVLQAETETMCTCTSNMNFKIFLRYHRTISVSELYKMRDTIEIREQGGAGRMVYLANSYPPTSTTPTSDSGDGDVNEILEQPACPKHCPEGSVTYAEAVNRCMLPLVRVRLKTFAADVHTLLLTHEGNMPLMRFVQSWDL